MAKDGEVAFEYEPFDLEVDETDGALHYPFFPPTSYKRPWECSDDDEDCGFDGDTKSKSKRLNSRSLSPISFGSPDTSLDSDNNRELPWTGYNFFDLRHHPETVYVDKTGSVLQLSDTFRHILLRPPRFGKTAFLSTLEQYCDIQEAAQFDERFGSLAATTEIADATVHDIARPHSQHLCLSFAFSEIWVLSEITEITLALSSHVGRRLSDFLAKYAAELQLSEPQKFLKSIDSGGEPRTLSWFAIIFDLVKASGHTLFVGVDDYDSPILRRSFMHLQDPVVPRDFARPQDIECLLDRCFWGPLRGGSDVIAKLFVTGTLSPTTLPNLVNLRMLDLKDDMKLQPSCGFTEQEALTFAGAFLDDMPDPIDLRRTCGQYIFSSADASTEPVLHPQELILRIAELSQKPVMPYTPKSFPLLAAIFEHLPENSDDFGVVTTDALIDLLSSGSVPVDTQNDAPGAFDGTNVTWNDIHHLGALTFDHQGTLRIANTTILSLIHEHVDTVFADRHDLQHVLFYALYPYEVDADPKLLLELFSMILCSQMRRAFDSRHCVEPNVHGIFELVMRNTRCAQTSREIDPVILSPHDKAAVVEIRNPDRDTVQRLALKTLTLRGLWRGANPNDDQPSIGALRELHTQLLQEDEECIMARPYNALGTGETALVRTFLEVEQGIPVVLAVGGARVLMRSD
ncbi:hypothetical protein C8R47DRAFT_714987 [Mycena vitilis]|nr:hypothetical protein C8R47DRAFT_714987 [Mycena vitilis]